MELANKLTKTMLVKVNRWELRKLVILSMGFNVNEAYDVGEKELIEWIYKKPEEFSVADVSLIKEARNIRPGVVPYLEAIQKYILGETDDSPKLDEFLASEMSEGKWEQRPSIESLVARAKNAEKVEVEPVIKTSKAPTKKKSLRKKVASKKLTVVESPEELPLEVEVISEPTPTESIQDALNNINATLEESKQVYNANLETVVRDILAVNNQLNMMRQEQALNLAAISNAILYLLNAAVQDEGEEFTSLSDIPIIAKEVL